MACDGDIDKREVALIKRIHQEKKIFGEINISQELKSLVQEINRDGHKFLKSYFHELTTSNLSEQDEFKLIEVAIETIRADEKVEYNEIKFFKVIRSKLKIPNDPVLEAHPDYEEFLEQDIISESYLARLQDEFLNTQTLPVFELKSSFGDEILNDSEKKKDK